LLDNSRFLQNTCFSISQTLTYGILAPMNSTVTENNHLTCLQFSHAIFWGITSG